MEMRLLEEEEKGLRQMELARKGSAENRKPHSGNLNNSGLIKRAHFPDEDTTAESPDIQRKPSDVQTLFFGKKGWGI